MRWLTAIPVYNEAKYVHQVLAEVRRFSPQILVVNDGSSDGTSQLLDGEPDLLRVTHVKNRGYGAAIRSCFDYAINHGFDVLVTMDCDGQHEPSRIPLMLEAIGDCDIASGSRYLRDFRQNTPVPEERLRINQMVSAELNQRFGLKLTDAFCGFKAYRVSALRKFNITQDGWGMAGSAKPRMPHWNWQPGISSRYSITTMSWPNTLCSRWPGLRLNNRKQTSCTPTKTRFSPMANELHRFSNRIGRRSFSSAVCIPVI